MKKIMLIMLMLFTALSGFAASSVTRGELGDLKWTLDKGVMSVTGTTLNKKEVTSVIIPPKINDVSVTKIGKGAFKGCKNLYEVSIPDSVIEISDSAFEDCTGITEIQLPSKLQKVGAFAFRKCSLSTVIVPGSVTIIGDEAFNCDSLISFKILNASVKIGDGLFKNCFNLSEIDLGTKCISLGENVFSGCKIDTVTLPDSIKTMGKSVFSKSEIKKITLPNSLETLGDNAFFGCKKLKSIEIPDSVKIIGKNVFKDCESLETVKLSNSVKIIQKGLFKNCIKLKEIEIPSSVTVINSDNFDSPFSGCKELSSVFIKGNITVLPQGLFNSLSKLKTVELPDSIVTIEDSAFFETSVENLIIPPSVRKIESLAFSEYKASTPLIIPDGVREIGSDCFYDCNGVYSIPDSVETFGDSSFVDCYNLKQIKIRKNAEYGKRVFGGYDIDKIDVEEGTESFDFGIFSHRGGVITELNLPKSVKMIKFTWTENAGEFGTISIMNPDAEIELVRIECKINKLICSKSVYEKYFSNINTIKEVVYLD